MSMFLWTNLKARLQFIKYGPGANVNWIFLPGGPGLGSESLSGLTEILKLPGNMWHLDLPGDGSNHTPNDEKYFSRWSDALCEVVTTLPNIILVAHSTGGMYILATPSLEKKIIGLILMNSAPDASWQKDFMKYVQAHPIKQIQKLHIQYSKKPTNILLKKITLASAPYSFTLKGLKKGISLLKHLPFNCRICEWSGKHFDSTYTAKWVPNNIPTLVLGGSEDHIIPLKFFIQSKKFRRKNIILCSITNAGHFPWIDNPKEIIRVFKNFSKNIIKINYSKTR